MTYSNLHLRRFIQHDEIGMGNNQFRCFYMAFHPVNGSFIVHEGNAGKIYMDGKLIYSYSLIGRAPRAGGDTHGAITWSRDLVFVGGWIKAPPGLLVSTDRTLARQDMREKYSHIHTVDENGKVELLWYRKWDDKIPPNHWYGEVTDLLYDGHEDVLYFSRADGYAELGLWRIYLSDRKVEWLIRNRTVYKMELKDDKIFATLFNPAHMENSAIAIYDIISNESRVIEEFEYALEPGRKVSIKRDGGQIVQIQNRLISFYGGAMIVSDPYRDRHMLYPFLEIVSPESERPAYIPGLRTQKVYPLGIPIIAVNPSEGLTEPALRTTFGLLIRVDPVVPQILSTTGFVSGMISDGEYLYLGTSYANHCPAYTYRTGDGGIFAIPIKDLFTKPWTPIRIWIFDGEYIQNNTGLFGWFGGIPLKGFTVKRLRIYVSQDIKMRIVEYDLLTKTSSDSIALLSGWNNIDLSQYYDMIAFSFDTNLNKVLAEIILEP
ncbi:conserved hypothetical protein [Ignisphaera aggregans DSM 17230]|uniref:DUF2139 domain-containing protein n=1 Tax=Ignisphaera aggregans (strain DSM 17230 / JCM 13409 / AQ1.S1) TaxID=583356 RepID=E0SS33_IGNAA|nr:conserved hypothetical protein [Ignisphaera aggregans DSM 17230]